MQISPASVSPRVLSSQIIDQQIRTYPHRGTTMIETVREQRIAGARDGIATFATADDAIKAAAALSAGSAPGLAVVAWRGGFRLHDVHTVSRTWLSNSSFDGMPFPFPPMTRELHHSSVPFAAGNFRTPAAPSHTTVSVRDAGLAALVDGTRVFVPVTDARTGRSLLIERR